MDIKHFTFSTSSRVDQMRSKHGQSWWAWLDHVFYAIHSVFQLGTKAPQAGGKIHTDFEKGFIMAEVSQ